MAHFGFHTTSLSSHHMWKQRVMRVLQSCASLCLGSHFSTLIITWCYHLHFTHNDLELTIPVIEIVQLAHKSFPGDASGKNPPASAEGIGVVGSILGSGRSPGGGHGNPLQYSCLENSMDRGSRWPVTVHRVPRSWIWLKRLSTHARTYNWLKMLC